MSRVPDQNGDYTAESEPVRTSTGRHLSIYHDNITNPPDSNELHTLRQSTTVKTSARTTRITDQTGEGEPKTDSVHTGTARQTTASHPTPGTRRIPAVHQRTRHQQPAHRTRSSLRPRTKPENESRKQIRSTQVPTVMYPSTTTAPETRSIPTIRQQT